ncbi:hypothetical protein GCM10027589_02530 [Actinocorallia lasiicapitis]
MSVAEIPREPEFERVPPHDINAEQCVLGGMMLSQDAISDVIEELKSSDFYRPAHQIIYDVVLDIYGRGEPVDAITVGAELTKKGEAARTGGAPYLFTLINSVPTAANAGYYAKIVQERSILRRLVEAGTRIVQLGYAQGAEADDLLDQAQAEVYAIADKRSGEDYQPLSEIMPGALDELEAISSRDGSMIGCPTGFTDLDALTNGLHGGQMIVVAARPAMGKALELSTALPTPTGWTTMGEVNVGDLLIGGDGKPTRVVAATTVMIGRPCYEVEFSDGTVIVADAEHQWKTTTRASRRQKSENKQNLSWANDAISRVRDGGQLVVRHVSVQERAERPIGFATTAVHTETKTTEEIAKTLRCADGRPNHAVPTARTFDLPEVELAVHPYVLGAWLGAGISSDEAGLSAKLREIGVFENKHIPQAYLRASREQRMDLLAGLLDTDGSISEIGQVQFGVVNKRLADDFLELVLSLGWKATIRAKKVEGRREETSTFYRIDFTPTEIVFGLSRKAERQRAKVDVDAKTQVRYIVDVRPIESVPVRCVQVDNDDHMYLASRACIPTHNSTLALDFVRAASIKHGLTSAFFSLEMGRNEITMRLLSAEARVALHAMRSGTMNDDDWTRLARRMSEVAEAPLFIDDSPNMSMMEIRAKCRRLKQQHDLRLVVIDYLQLMTSGKRVESRQVEVSEFSRNLKLLAKELHVPVIALSQLNRGPEQRTDKRPMVSDLRESGSIEQDADMVILLHREDAYEKESPRAGEADLIVAKHRNGPTATVTVAFQGHYSRFVDMATS